jgi:ABC-type spermidine/putrescine transport system permease subunit II
MSATGPDRRSAGGFGLSVFSLMVLMFLCLPITIIVPMSFSSAKSLQFPPPGLSLRWYESFFGDERWIEAGINSLILAGTASVCALVLGTLAAYGLVRGRFPGRALLESNFMAPMIIPPIILAVAMFIALARLGFLGSFGGLIIAHTVLVIPYAVLIMTVAIQSFDRDIELVAMTLGASRTRVLVQIVLPNLMPSALAALIFAFVISFDEVIVTLFVSGTYMTIPKRMFNELILQINPTITAIASILIFASIVSVALVAWLMHRSGLLKRELV